MATPTTIQVKTAGFVFNGKVYVNRGLQTVAINQFLQNAIDLALQRIVKLDTEDMPVGLVHSKAYELFDKAIAHQVQVLPIEKRLEYRNKLRTRVGQHLLTTRLGNGTWVKG